MRGMRSASMKREVASRSPSYSNVTTPPKPRIKRVATSWLGCEARPGYHTRLMRLCFSRNSAIACADAFCCSTRSASVLSPRCTRYPACGSHTAPIMCRTSRTSQRVLDAELRQKARHELACAAIAIREQDHVLAGLDQRQDRAGDRGHAAAEEQRVLAALERGHALFDQAHRGIAVAPVLLAL